MFEECYGRTDARTDIIASILAGPICKIVQITIHFFHRQSINAGLSVSQCNEQDNLKNI